MKLKFYTLICLFISAVTFAQNLTPSKNINGNYTTLVAEKGVSGPSNDKIIELMENNGTLMLGVAACGKCFPAVYTYNKELSEGFGKVVFANSAGIYALTYDDDSFAIVYPSPRNATEKFGYVNFYSKSKVKAKAMTKEKIETYGEKLLTLLK